MKLQLKKSILAIMMLFAIIANSQITETVVISQEPITTTQRDALTVPVGEFWKIYNSTTDQEERWDGSAWTPLVGGAGGTDDQAASEVPNTPSGNLIATDVQGALNELQTELDTSGGGGGIQTVTGASVDNTDPLNPIINASVSATGIMSIEEDSKILYLDFTDESTLDLSTDTINSISDKFGKVNFASVTGKRPILVDGKADFDGTMQMLASISIDKNMDDDDGLYLFIYLLNLHLAEMQQEQCFPLMNL